MTMKARFWMSLAVSASLASVSMADVTGKATFDGKAPDPKKITMTPQCAALHANPVFDETYVVGEKGELKNVVVFVKEGGKLGGEAAPGAPVILDQKDCIYTPHVVTARVGQELKAKNSDGFLHNVHGLAKQGEFNFPQTTKDQEDPIPANKEVETYKVKCDIHPWMNAWVVILDHSFSSVTGDNGEFAIKGLKDGKVTLVAWHERLGTQEAEVEVKDGKATAPVEFKFKPKAKAAAGPADVKTTLTAIVKPADEACEHCEKDATTVVKTDAVKPAVAATTK
jgi:plastocyanin